MSEAFFQKIHSAVATGPIRTDARSKPDFTVARIFDDKVKGEELRTLFAQRATAAGSTAHQPKNMDELVEKIQQIVPANSIVIVDPTLACEKELSEKLKNRYTIHFLDQADDKILFDAFAVITAVDCAVAETGSVVIAANQRRSRLASLVAEVHFALIRPDQITPDWMDIDTMFKKTYGEKTPNGLAIISGPSKTADIEMNLVVGVHGPGQMHMVLLPTNLL